MGRVFGKDFYAVVYLWGLLLRPWLVQGWPCVCQNAPTTFIKVHIFNADSFQSLVF